MKAEAAKRSAKYIQDLDSINREQKADQDRLDNVSRLRADAENKHSQKCHVKQEMERRIKKLAEHIRYVRQCNYCVLVLDVFITLQRKRTGCSRSNEVIERT